MDIFFCDLCGARVTDADLRAGHGTRRVWDVICGACLEQGHGQEWLSRRADAKPGDAATLAASTATAPPPSAAAAVLDRARDRAPTVEQDEDPPQRVVAQPVLVEDALPVGRDDHIATTRVPQPDQAEPQLSSAAGAFSRLGAGQPGPVVDEPSMRDDLVDGEDIADGGMTPTPPPAASPFSFDAADKPDGKSSSQAGATSRPASGLRPRAPGSASRSAPAANKAGKSTSGRISKSRPRVQDDSGRKILMLTGISAVVIVIAMVAVVLSRPRKIVPTEVVFRPKQEIQEKVKHTKALAVSALRSHDMNELQSARTAIDDTAQALDRFQDLARNQVQPHWTEQQIESFIENELHWQATYMLKVSIMQDIEKQQQRQ